MDTKEWRKVEVEYGRNFLSVKVPPWCDVLEMGYTPALDNPGEHIEDSLSHPIESLPVESIIASSKKDPSRITVAIAVSDNTRPVPYNADKEEGILLPLLNRLKKAGVKNKNIRIVVGTGTHIPTSDTWKKEAFGEFIKDNYEIIDHDSTSEDLISIGKIEGIEVKINEVFLQSDIHIVTGLVEPHFMAGVSGGRKAICPGLINIDATYVFHGVEFMDHPNATNLVLEGNPCHRFALEVARRVRVDFNVSVTINGEGKLTGIFTGDLEKSHLEAVKKLKEYVVIPCDNEYDVILTQGGKVAVNHYQAAKAAYGVIPIIKRGGIVILVAHNSDGEPIGKDEYKKVLKVLREKGPGRFTEFIRSKNWKFVPDQWQVQKWDQFFKKIGSFDNLIYCTDNIPPEKLKDLPGKSGYDFIKEDTTKIESMVQNAIVYAIEKIQHQLKRELRMAFVKEGPYAVPLLSTEKRV